MSHLRYSIWCFFIKNFCFFIILISHHWTLILGDGHFVACSCMLISRNSSIVFKGSSPLQTDVSLWQVPIICSLCLHHLVSYCVVFSSDVLDLGLCLKSNWTYRGCLWHDESSARQPCVNPRFSSFTFWLLFIVICIHFGFKQGQIFWKLLQICFHSLERQCSHCCVCTISVLKNFICICFSSFEICSYLGALCATQQWRWDSFLQFRWIQFSLGNC